jgi:NhaB family Na+:H+ antiporter
MQVVLECSCGFLESVFHEIEANLEVILLLIFMVAATHFLKYMLLFIFTKILLYFRRKTPLSLAFQLSAAVLSAFLDALTVTAVLIAVIAGLAQVYRRFQRLKRRETEKVCDVCSDVLEL